MGLFDRLFGNRPKVKEADYQGFFKMGGKEYQG